MGSGKNEDKPGICPPPQPGYFKIEFERKKKIYQTVTLKIKVIKNHSSTFFTGFTAPLGPGL
jgi:hypothetical protein